MKELSDNPLVWQASLPCEKYGELRCNQHPTH